MHIPTPTEEHVVLVDEHNNVLGTAPKATVHQAVTPLHRAFSAFLFAADGRLLLQQRSHKKKTWPLMWSNSVCGHPALGEDTLDAVRRRMRDELGLTAVTLREAAPYRYTFSKDGVMENEICPIHVGTIDTEPVLNPDEVEAVRWVEWSDFMREVREHPEHYSEWCVEEALILDTLPGTEYRK
jgi:isopentenyl-diphosphate Delta-isomerase